LDGGGGAPGRYDLYWIALKTSLTKTEESSNIIAVSLPGLGYQEGVSLLAFLEEVRDFFLAELAHICRATVVAK
jgi:hypothetical protein